jgi:hypothetical protein
MKKRGRGGGEEVEMIRQEGTTVKRSKVETDGLTTKNPSEFKFLV